MHRSRLSALAIFAGAAACSTRGDSDAKILSQDQPPVTALDGREKIGEAPLPGACAAAASPAQPTAAARSQADALARQGYRAEVLGNTRDARALLLRASELDGTDGVAAYHLGRASEALGDRTGAVSAYCRYLALAPTTAESAEARQRVAMLSPGETRVSAGIVSNSAPATRPMASATRRQVSYPIGAGRARAASVRSAARVASSRRRAQPARSVAVGDDGSAPTDATIMSQEGDSRGSPTAAGTDDAASPRRPAADQPRNASRPASGGLGRVQSAGMGAVTGAIIGTAAGRSVKSAILGAAAGGLFGAVVGGRVD